MLKSFKLSLTHAPANLLSENLKSPCVIDLVSRLIAEPDRLTEGFRIGAIDLSLIAPILAKAPVPSQYNGPIYKALAILVTKLIRFFTCTSRLGARAVNR